MCVSFEIQYVQYGTNRYTNCFYYSFCSLYRTKKIKIKNSQFKHLDFFCGSFWLFRFRVCHTFLSVHCSLVVTCWERANLLALLYVTFSCGFGTFPCGVLGQVWYLIVSIPDLCLFTYIELPPCYAQRI